MPIYEYQCDSCGYIFEEFQGINDQTVIICPKCGGSAKRKISAGVGLIFKGSGFYITDYKRGNSSSKTKSESESGGSKSEKSD